MKVNTKNPMVKRRCPRCKKDISERREEAGYGQIQVVEIGHDPKCLNFEREYALDDHD